MRILLVTHRYPPLGVTGVERLSEQTARALTTAGHEVTVLTRHNATAPPLPRLHRTEQDGVNVVTVAGGGPLLGMFPKLAPVLERLFEITLLEVQPDVVLISHLVDHSPTYVSIAHRWHVAVVMELHDFFVACERAHLERISGELCDGPEAGRACAAHCFAHQDRSLERWALRTELFRRAFEEADALLCPSQFVAAYFERTFGPCHAPLRVIGNGVGIAGPAPAAGSRPGPLHLACVGVVAAHKGLHVVVEALRLARLPRARLTLIGEIHPSYFRSVVASAKQVENLECRAYGRFAPEELPFLLADVHAVIIPSLVWETYSIAAREAMACGVPVIASRLGALPEVVRHGQNGLLFEPSSPLDLATILQLIDRDRGRLHALRAGIRDTDWISIEERTSRLEQVLAEVSAAGPRLGPSPRALEELTILRDGFVELRRT